VVDGDAGAGGFSGEETRGGAQQIAGVHQDDAAVHVFHLLSGTSGSEGECFGFASSLPDRRSLKVPNWIIGVAYRR
jgi:hypothetical protein